LPQTTFASGQRADHRNGAAVDQDGGMSAPAPSTANLPVSDPWFVRERVDDGVTLVTERHVHPLLRCNVWHVRGTARDLVIDTALGLAPLRQAVAGELGHPVLAVATHSHTDHVGGLHEFEQRAIHRAEAGDVEAPMRATVASEHYGETVLGPYRDAGYEIPGLFVDAVPAGGLRSVTHDIPAAPATTLLADGDLIDCGNRAFEVLHLPGHSPGSIGLWEAATGILFSGDAVYDGPLLDELEGSDVDDYVVTMRRLRELPVTVVHGGHERSFGRERLVELCDAYLAARAV
jgi:glyoxylase-like metal-dependent hydrolase (beta-lactamase superfamily II)